MRWQSVFSMLRSASFRFMWNLTCADAAGPVGFVSILQSSVLHNQGLPSHGLLERWTFTRKVNLPTTALFAVQRIACGYLSFPGPGCVLRRRRSVEEF